MTKYGRVIGTNRRTARIRLELKEVPDASCGVAGRLAEDTERPKAACPAQCQGCGPVAGRPSIIEIPRSGLRGGLDDFPAGTRVRIEFPVAGTALSAFFGVVFPCGCAIATFFALMPVSRIFAYFGALGALGLFCALYALLRQRLAFLSGARVFPATEA